MKTLYETHPVILCSTLILISGLYIFLCKWAGRRAKLPAKLPEVKSCAPCEPEMWQYHTQNDFLYRVNLRTEMVQVWLGGVGVTAWNSSLWFPSGFATRISTHEARSDWPEAFEL